ncbi:hypothetical protein [Kutzneria albida]|uniref:hypothetical protein n=1 Tax=Kutzneria albida TaxID=43357 RepID=UPI0011DE1778|nr:hypothetical protein [Kutzneria albida]
MITVTVIAQLGMAITDGSGDPTTTARVGIPPPPTWLTPVPDWSILAEIGTIETDHDHLTALGSASGEEHRWASAFPGFSCRKACPTAVFSPYCGVSGPGTWDRWNRGHGSAPRAFV